MQVIDTPSPNHDDRGGASVAVLVLHDSAADGLDAVLARLRDPASGLSCHYLVAEDGAVHRLVDERRRAWHAGASHWRGWNDVDAVSIGICLVNPEHGSGCRPYADAQVDATVRLVAKLKDDHAITRGNVVGHSDVAPARARGPGELFPWHRLARLRLALPRPTRNLLDPMWSEAAFLLALERFGYDVTERMAAIMAFQRRFRPELVDGEIDAECRMILLALLLPKPTGDE